MIELLLVAELIGEVLVVGLTGRWSDRWKWIRWIDHSTETDSPELVPMLQGRY